MINYCDMQAIITREGGPSQQQAEYIVATIILIDYNPPVSPVVTGIRRYTLWRTATTLGNIFRIPLIIFLVYLWEMVAQKPATRGEANG